MKILKRIEFNEEELEIIYKTALLLKNVDNEFITENLAMNESNAFNLGITYDTLKKIYHMKMIY